MLEKIDNILLEKKLRTTLYGMLIRNIQDDSRLDKIYTEYENRGLLDDYEKIVFEVENKYFELIEKV